MIYANVSWRQKSTLKYTTASPKTPFWFYLVSDDNKTDIRRYELKFFVLTFCCGKLEVPGSKFHARSPKLEVSGTVFTRYESCV